MVRSATDDDKGTAPPKPVRKIWTMGSFPATDKDFLEWCENQAQFRGTRSRSYGTLDAMKLYVQHRNIESKMLYERQLKERKDQIHLAEPVDAVLTSKPGVTKAPDDTDDTTMNILNPQIISFPNSQNILSPDSQNISQSPEHSAPLILEPPSQISPTLPPPTLLPPTVPRAEQQREQRTGVDPNSNRLTMEEALELFALMQARRTAEIERPLTIEAHQVDVATTRAKPLSFLTLETVKGIVGSTDFEVQEGRTSWEESKMEKCIGLGDAYSSMNTLTGEKCYMVDRALYRDILLAVAARKQNERSLVAATEKLEQHIGQIESSNERVLQVEKDALEKMAQRMNNSYLSIRDEHQTRMNHERNQGTQRLHDNLG
jgi:hypothetical protein